jgi:5-methylcytosine-specific restriction endonuclease McrA
VSAEDIPAATRRRVLARDNYRCRCCGDEELVGLTLHHVRYRSHGGDHSDDNLVTLCIHCHTLIHRKKLFVGLLDGHWFFGHTDHWRNQR